MKNLFSTARFRKVEGREQLLVVLGFGVIAFLILPVIFLYPFNADTDLWQWITTVSLRYGGLPYVAAWDHDFPGVMIFHAIALTLFGNSMLGFRAVEYGVILLTIVALYRTCRLWLTPGESMLGCMLFAFYYAYGRWDCMGQRDSFAMLPIVLSCFYFVTAMREHDGRARDWRMAIGGILIGFATCIRPTYALLLAVPLILWYRRSDRKGCVILLAGFAAPVVLMVLPFALTPDGLRQAYFSVVRYNTDIYNHFPPSPERLHWYLVNALQLRSLVFFILAVCWIAGRAILRVRKIPNPVRSKDERRFLLLSFLALILGIYSQWSLSACHFAALYAGFIPVLAKMMSDLARILNRWRSVAQMALLVIVAGVLYPFGLVRLFLEHQGSFEYAYRYFPGQLEFIREEVTIASYVTRHTTPNEYVEVIGNPAISWRINRRMSNAYSSPWTFLQFNPSEKVTEYQKEWREIFFRSLVETNPKYIVIARDETKHPSVLSDLAFERMPDITGFIQHNYTLDTLLDHHAIYARR